MEPIKVIYQYSALNSIPVKGSIVAFVVKENYTYAIFVSEEGRIWEALLSELKVIEETEGGNP